MSLTGSLSMVEPRWLVSQLSTMVQGSVWTTRTASLPRVATSPFTTPVEGYQVCVVTAYGSDGTALGSLTVQRESSIVCAANMQGL